MLGFPDMPSKIGCVRVRLGTKRESAEITSLFAILNHVMLSTSKERKGLTSGRKTRKRREEERICWMAGGALGRWACLGLPPMLRNARLFLLSLETPDRRCDNSFFQDQFCPLELSFFMENSFLVAF